MSEPIEISLQCGYHRRGRPGALNDLLRMAGELIIPAVHSASVEFSIACDRKATYSYTSGSAKVDTYETTIVQEWARYMSSHAAFADYGVVWEAKFRTGERGRPPAVDIVLEDERSSASRKAALIEVKVSDAELDEESLWSDAKKLWELQAGGSQSGPVGVEAKMFVVNVVRGLKAGTTPASFEELAKALADKSKAWDPRFGPVFTAVFPVFRPSSDVGGGRRSAMWEICGVAGFELSSGDDR